ncbi:MAG: fructose-6-phosphate aldolase [Dehalococcoidia bacterium]
MQIWLDTANIEEIREASKLGVVKGVTTNPSLVAKEGDVDFRSRVLEICDIIDGPVCAEVLSLEAEGMIAEGRDISRWAPNIVVKIPTTAAGLEAISVLSQEGIKINQTLCFSVNQVLLGASAGSTYVSPFVGRLDDVGHDGIQLVADMVEVFSKHNIKSLVIAASLRHPLHCVAAAKAGAHIATIPYKVLMQMLKHPLTDIGLTRFVEDWHRLVKV